MPTYNYACDTCGAKFEKFVSFSGDPHHAACPNGHKHVRRVFNTPTIVFKGKGFYVTDNHSPKKTTEAE